MAWSYSSNSEQTLSDVINGMTDEQKTVTFALIKLASQNKAEKPEELKDRQMVKNVIDGMTDEQRIAMYAMIGMHCSPADEASSNT